METIRKSIGYRRIIIIMCTVLGITLGIALGSSLIRKNNQGAPVVFLASTSPAFGETASPIAPPFVIVLDAGHGGSDPGAEGASGNYEKNYTLALAQKVFRLLQKETMFKPLMTRTDDTFIELEDRSAYANEKNADAFVSIHGNTFKDPGVSGTETYYFAQGSYLLAQALHQEIVKATGFSDRGVRQEGWRVLRYSEAPSVLLEIGFLTNHREEAYLLGEKGQDRIAQAIVDGLMQYFSIK